MKVPAAPTATIPGDRRPMKLWSWLGAVRDELINTTTPAELVAQAKPDMLERMITLGPKVAEYLTDVAEAAAIKQDKE